MAIEDDAREMSQYINSFTDTGWLSLSNKKLEIHSLEKMRGPKIYRIKYDEKNIMRFTIFPNDTLGKPSKSYATIHSVSSSPSIQPNIRLRIVNSFLDNVIGFPYWLDFIDKHGGQFTVMIGEDEVFYKNLPVRLPRLLETEVEWRPTEMLPEDYYSF